VNASPQKIAICLTKKFKTEKKLRSRYCVQL